MGFYIQGPSKGKVRHIVEQHGGKIATYAEALETMKTEPGKAVVCVVDNVAFDTAGFCYDMHELNSFSDPDDRRRKTWVIMDRDKACELSGYKERSGALASR